MAIRWEEHPDSGAFSFNPPKFDLKWRALDEFDADIVRSYAMAVVPQSVFTQVGKLWLQDIAVAPDGWCRFVVSATYGPQKKQNGTFSFAFDATGVNVRIKGALEHIKTYLSDGSDGGNPHEGLIGVKPPPDFDVEGTDVLVPALKLNVNFKHPQGIVTIAYAKNVSRMVGRTNSIGFLGFDAGELMFVGANGQEGTECDTEVNYGFLASENATGLTIAGISGIARGGHHVLWIEPQPGITSGKAVAKPKAIHVERVAHTANFASVLGWG